MSDIFAALADPTRRRVVRLLGERPRRVGELADATRSSRPAMSRHLRILLHCGIVEDRRGSADARQRIFRLHPDSLTEIQQFLDEIRADWERQLQSFKQHVESPGPP
jgi:DNA-binding transcriptional ArsR family regulator